MITEKLPISALVASYNDAHLLEDCLKSIGFCDEIVVVNLNSKDNTEEIAKKYCTRYFLETEWVPYFDKHHKKYIPQLKNEWFLLMDSDERLMPDLIPDIKLMLQNAEPELACIRTPMFNYFKGKKLNGTVYGGLHSFRLLYKYEGVTISDEVHTSIKLKEGYTRRKIHFNGKNYNQHLWCTGFKHFIEKHKRYNNGEGQSQYNLGLRYSFRKQMMGTIIKFYYSYKGRQGYKDGLTGLFLSVLAAFFEYKKWNSLRKYQKNLSQN